MDRVDIFIAQSVAGPRRIPGAYGYVIKMMTRKGEATVGDFDTGLTYTAHEMELQAIIAVLGRLRKPCELHLHSRHDYFRVTVENMWLIRWQQNGWINSKGNEVENHLMYKEILDLIECGGHQLICDGKDLGEYTTWLPTEVMKKADKYKKELENVAKLNVPELHRCNNIRRAGSCNGRKYGL